MMKGIIDKSFYRLKGYCEKQENCDYCRFNDDGECDFRKSVPCDWEMPVKKRDGDE